MSYNLPMPSHLYLSPHLDDVVLSCGGLIAQQTAAGESVSVLTVCAGDAPPGPLSSFAHELHARWGEAEAPIASRRAEDRVACGRLDASVIHFDIPDAVYRRGDGGEVLYSSERAIFSLINPQEADLELRLAHLLKEACPTATRLYCPLVIGGHVDHRLTRRAAEGLSRQLWYYQDLPYAARGGHIPPDLGLPNGIKATWPLSSGEIDAWAAATATYRSQLSTFWSDVAALHRELRDFHDAGGGIRILAPEGVDLL